MCGETRTISWYKYKSVCRWANSVSFRKYRTRGDGDDDGYVNSTHTHTRADNRRSHENITKSVYKSNKWWAINKRNILIYFNITNISTLRSDCVVRSAQRVPCVYHTSTQMCRSPRAVQEDSRFVCALLWCSLEEALSRVDAIATMTAVCTVQ